MSDQEKIERIKEILREWANSNDGSGVGACAEIMGVLDFDPYPRDEYDAAVQVKKAAAQK